MKPVLAVELARVSCKRRQATVLCLPSGSSISAGLSQVWVLVLWAHVPVVRQVVGLIMSSLGKKAGSDPEHIGGSHYMTVPPTF